MGLPVTLVILEAFMPEVGERGVGERGVESPGIGVSGRCYLGNIGVGVGVSIPGGYYYEVRALLL